MASIPTAPPRSAPGSSRRRKPGTSSPPPSCGTASVDGGGENGRAMDDTQSVAPRLIPKNRSLAIEDGGKNGTSHGKRPTSGGECREAAEGAAMSPLVSRHVGAK